MRDALKVTSRNAAAYGWALIEIRYAKSFSKHGLTHKPLSFFFSQS